MKKSDMDFNSQIEKLKDDCIIKKYFNGKNLIDFMHLYIKIDRLLEKKHVNIENDDFIDELCNNLKNHIEQVFDKKIKKDTFDIIDTKMFLKTFLSSEVEVENDNIYIIKHNKPKVMICSKNVDGVISRKDVDKFYNMIKNNNCCGILCNAYGGIVDKDHLSIDVINNNIVVFIHKHKFDDTMIKMALNIIYNMYNMLREKEGVMIDTKLFNNLKHEYLYFVQSFDNHMDMLKSNIDSLSNLKLTLLDNFFKRKIISSDTKPFSCYLCGTGFTSDKALKRHSKNMHPKEKKTKIIKTNDPESDNESDNEKDNDSENDNSNDVENDYKPPKEDPTYHHTNVIDF